MLLCMFFFFTRCRILILNSPPNMGCKTSSYKGVINQQSTSCLPFSASAMLSPHHHTAPPELDRSGSSGRSQRRGTRSDCRRRGRARCDCDLPPGLACRSVRWAGWRGCVIHCVVIGLGALRSARLTLCRL